MVNLLVNTLWLLFKVLNWASKKFSTETNVFKLVLTVLFVIVFGITMLSVILVEFIVVCVLALLLGQYPDVTLCDKYDEIEEMYMEIHNRLYSVKEEQNEEVEKLEADLEIAKNFENLDKIIEEIDKIDKKIEKMLEDL